MSSKDEKLLSAAIKGDTGAFEELIEKYEKLIYNIAYRMFYNYYDAKDMSQEAIIKIYRNIDKCKGIDHFKPWICAITTNVCIDELRKRKRNKTESIDEQIEIEEGNIKKQIVDEGKTPEEQFINKELGQELKNALATLNDNQRNIVILRDIIGLSYEELAVATGASLGTVKSRLARGRDNLRLVIEKNQEQ